MKVEPMLKPYDPKQTKLPTGVITGVPFEKYCLDPGVNASTLKHFAGRTPKHAKASMDAEEEDTQSMAIGHAAHTAIFEPDLYDEIYAIFPKAEFNEKYGRANSNAYKAAKAAWDAEHAKAIPLADTQHEHAQAIRNAVLDHKLARSLLIDGKGFSELTVICEDEGGRRKARLDRLTYHEGAPAIVDLKTINTKGRVLNKHVCDGYTYTYGVHLQLPWYADRLNEHVPADRQMLIVFVENEPPYDVVVRPLDEDAAKHGRDDAATYYEQLIKGRETGYWPGYSDSLEDPAGLPRYAQEDDLL